MTNVSTTEICPACRGSGDCRDPSEVQQRILELEGHVQELNERAALTGKCGPHTSIIARMSIPRTRTETEHIHSSRSHTKQDQVTNLKQLANSPTTKKKSSDYARHKPPTPRPEAAPRDRQHPPTQTVSSHLPKPRPPYPPRLRRIYLRKRSRAASRPSPPCFPTAAVAPLPARLSQVLRPSP
jgi:hypothetical protein